MRLSCFCKRERFSKTPTFEVECGVRECLSFLREHRVLWRETKWWVWTIPPSYWSLSATSHAKTHMLAGKKWSKSVEDVGRETRSCMNKKRTYMYCKASQMIETIHSPAKMQCHFVIFEHHICTKTIHIWLDFVILLARMLVTRNERDETKTKRGEKDCGMKY